MIIAATIWFLNLFGIAPSAQDFARMERQFYERGHHPFLEFSGTRFNGTRWTDSKYEKLMTLGLGYEYLVARRYNGVGFEVLGQELGPLLEPHRQRHEYFVGGGLSYYPFIAQRIFMQAGTRIKSNGDVEAAGRVGLGWRFIFFGVGAQPFAYVQTTTSGQFSWTLGARLQY